MPNKELGIADPVYDALRIRSGQSIAPDLGGGTTGGSGLENKIYVWHADGSTIDTFDADGAGLNLANAAAVSGDTIWLPSISITLSGTLTIAAGRTVTGISWASILIGTIANSGTLKDCAVTGNITNAAGGWLEHVYIANSSGTGITQAALARISKCWVQTGVAATYGIDISNGYCSHTVVGTDGGTISTGVYAHGANVEIIASRFAGYVGGKFEQGQAHGCIFGGSSLTPDANSHGLTHATTGTARLSNCYFFTQSTNSFGLYVTAAGLILTDCSWNTISGLASITYGTGDRSPLNHTHAAPSMSIQFVSGNVSNPPTEAEFEALLGVPATVGEGVPFLVLDAATSRYYLAVSDGSIYAYSPFIIPADSGSSTAPITLAASGTGWCWFADPRAVYYNGVTYFGFVDASGNIKMRTYTHATGAISVSTTIHLLLEADDHDNPSLLIRDSDKRILIFYSKHNGTTMYQRISTNAEDASTFAAEVDLDSQLGGDRYTYPSPIQLTGEANDPIYLFYRYFKTDFSVVRMAFSKSTDGGATWAAQTLLTQVTYHKVAQNGDSRIDFAVSHHPADPVDHGIYHFYYSGGNYYKSDGTQIVASTPFALTDLTQVYDGSSIKGWIWDIAIDGTGKPIIVFATFPTEWTDHRYNYARWTGAAWSVNEITAAGGTIYPVAGQEDQYSGGVVLDHTDPQIVYLSKVVSGKFEVYKYTTANGGASFSSTAITSGSTVKNVRPVAVRDHASDLKLLWLAGTYNSYTNFNMAILGSGQ